MQVDRLHRAPVSARFRRDVFAIRRGLALLAVVIFAALTAVAREAPTTGAVQTRAEHHLAEAVAGGLEPTDMYHLVLAFGWRETLPDWRWIAPALDRLTSARPVDPLMAAEVRLLRARVALDEGRPAAARELFQADGGLSGWWLSGPVPLDELEDFATRAEPPAAAAQWRPVPGTDPVGWVRVAGLVWPAQRRMVYLATTVASEREQPVALRLGAAQVARAWLNGTEVLTTPRPLAHAEDQETAGAWLRRGNNLLVVAVASESDDWWLRVRVTAPDGSRAAGVREESVPPQAVPGLDRPAPEVRSLESELRAAVAAGRPNARMALAAYLVNRPSQPLDSGDARAACAAARAEAPGEARLLESLITTEPKALRTLLEEAVEADPELVWARIALAAWYHKHGLFSEAAARLEPARDEPVVRAVQLDMEADLWGVLALPRLEALSSRAPRCVEVGVLLGREAVAAKRWTTLHEVLGGLRKIVPGRPEVLELDERAAVECGDSAGLMHQMTVSLERDPNLAGMRVRLARLDLAAGDTAASRRVLEQGLERSPDDPDLLLELARLEHADGHDQAATTLARRLLEVRPQERRAQRLLRLLGEGEDDSAWLRPPSELWKLADAAAGEGPAVAVLEHQELQFLPGQLTEERVQRAWLVRTAAQAKDLEDSAVAYVPERQRLRVLAARVLRRDGSEVSARQNDGPRLAEPEFNLYYDTRLRRFDFAPLEDGDLVELSYILSETSEANETGPYRGGLITIGGDLPTHLEEVAMVSRDGVLPAWELAHLEAEPVRSDEPGGGVRLQWVWHELAAVPRDVPPAPRLTVQAYLTYSNHPTWGELADWYGRHVAPRIVASRQVEELAHRLTDGLPDRNAKIRAIYRYVTDEIRYVGLELGEHRFRPFSADWVLNHGIGDCKDKAGFLVSLLGAVDIPARMVLLRTADEGPVASKLAVLEDFNHAIAYLPEDTMWLDGTASGHDPTLPPGLDQGAWALVIEGRDSRPVTTPVVGAGVDRLDFSLARGDAGTVDVSVAVEATGDAASRRRGTLSGSQDPRRIARWLQDMFPSASIVGEPEITVRPGRDPVTLKVHATVPRAALLAGGGIPTYPGELDLVSRLAPGGERHGPLLITVEPRQEWSVTVDLGRPPTTRPEALELISDIGKLRLTVEPRATGWRLAGTFELTPGLLPANRAGELRDFLVRVERALARPLEVP